MSTPDQPWGNTVDVIFDDQSRSFISIVPTKELHDPTLNREMYATLHALEVMIAAA